MAFDKTLIKKLMTILLPMVAFFHCLGFIMTCIDGMLENINFYYGIFVISFSLTAFFIQATFFIHYEVFILETLIGIIFSILYSFFYVIPLGFLSGK